MELKVDSEVKSALAGKVQWKYCWGSTLFHKDDLPFGVDLSSAPEHWSSFRDIVDHELTPVHPCLPVPAPGSLPLPSDYKEELRFEPMWSDLPYPGLIHEPSERKGMVVNFSGGEDVALELLRNYLWDSDLASKYHETRLALFGDYYSTQLSPWLSHGCISPRQIFERVREYEKACGANASTCRLLVELTWHDFSCFFAAKHGEAIFSAGGVKGWKKPWRADDELFRLWATGKTGYPLVDASMRELRATGYISNRARLNAASFLAQSMGFDWRRGADWFESHLVDYDAAVNWGNWVRLAGLTDGRVNPFNVVRQSSQFDPNGAYLRR